MTTALAIMEVLGQHVSDAAFYWQMRDDGLWSPAWSAEDMLRTDRMLDAHLEGIEVSPGPAAALALALLADKPAGEHAFIATYAWLHAPDPGLGAALEAILAADPSLARGSAAALHWAAPALVAPALRRWSNSDAPSLRRACLVPSLRRCDRSAEALHLVRALGDEDPMVVATALRYIGENQRREHAAHLSEALRHPHPAVATAASGALASLGLPGVLLAPAADLPLNQARHTLLLWATLAGDVAFHAWLTAPHTPPAAQVWALTWRGDTAAVPTLIDLLTIPTLAKLAAYALSHLTGVDLNRPGLTRNPPDDEPEDAPDPQHPQPDDAQDDAPIEDLATVLLPEPEPAAVASATRACLPLMGPGRSFVSGKRLDATHARHLLATGSQPQRWQAALYLARQGDAPSSIAASTVFAERHRPIDP